MELGVTIINSSNLDIPDNEIQFVAIRAQGSGGQNVDKASSAIHLHFDINVSSLSDVYKQWLLKLRDKRVSKRGLLSAQYRLLGWVFIKNEHSITRTQK